MPSPAEDAEHCDRGIRSHLCTIQPSLGAELKTFSNLQSFMFHRSPYDRHLLHSVS